MSEEKQYAFIEYLEKHKDDRAMLADLRRGLGRKAGETPSMFPYVVSFVNEWYEEENIYLVASLFALHPVSAKTGNMGNHLKTLTKALGDDSSTTRRFTQLLNQHRESLDAPLRQHITILKSKDIAINWHQLFRALNYWDDDDRFIQKQWAKSYWG
jgi:CRISPR system Cascade subunit CasB